MFRKAHLAALAAALTLPLAAPAGVQAEQPAKVTVCHLTGGANDVLFASGIPSLGISPANWVFGRMVEVNANAVDAHVGHGDSATVRTAPFVNVESGAYWTVAELVSIPGLGTFFANAVANGQYPNADCAIRYPIFP